MTTIGNYRVLQKIGEGGFAVIYQAENIIVGKKACLKQNKHASTLDARLIVEEARILWSLDEHHSIPSVKEVIPVSPDNYVMVMKYIEGKTLEDTIANHSGLHPEDACWITERLLEALYYCHCNGVIHSDVKPGNVFVEPSKRDIKLIDFGIASYKPTSSTAPIGYTPRYAAPELALGKPPIPETDIYGAGMVMLYALGGDTGKKGFPRDTPRELVEYCSSLIRYNPLERPSWERENPIQGLSDLRLKLFGRRHMH